jgi:NitT/TauT family transport system substrate-binding protein
VAGAPFPEARCAANRDAGTIKYLSGFDFAATASIIDVVVAEDRGYFEDLCLDVELTPSGSTANYPIVAAGDAQFASGGSFSEVVNFAAANEAELVAVSVQGRSAIDSLIVKPGVAERLEDLEGTKIGVKLGAIPPSVAAMLASVGLVEGEDYETVLLDGFDPLVHIELPGIVGFPGYKSNEPGQLERAGVDFDLFAPSDYGIPGSFGVLFTTRRYLEEHPTAAQDFLRAAMRGLSDAMADPVAAAATAIERVEEGGNPNFLSLEGETFRWTTDVELLRADTPAGTGVGVPDPELLQAEVDAYAEVGLFEDGAPDITERFAVDPIAGVYDDTGEVIWPAS